MISSPIEPRSKAFQNFAKLVVFVAILLVWWGAATTTKQAGMVFADWPLSLGTINPPGWLEHMIPFLEHSHRLLAKLVGLLVLTLFSWAYVRSWRQGLEVLGIVLLLALVLGFYIAAGSQRLDAELKHRLLFIAMGLSLLPLSWLVWSWAARGWPWVEKLTALALIMVTTQAILGGLRVTEISNAFAVAHGCFAQCFFCVLILIVMISGEKWQSCGFAVSPSQLGRLKRAGALLVGIILLQLIFGASMRHFHRFALPDHDLFLTQGRLIPSFEDPMIAFLFLHKFTAFSLFFYVLGVFISFNQERGVAGMAGPRRHAGSILLLILLQITLGLTVIGTDKSFWVTNVHVLNGLLILAVSFVFAVRALRGNSREEALAKSAQSA